MLVFPIRAIEEFGLTQRAVEHAMPRVLRDVEKTAAHVLVKEIALRLEAVAAAARARAGARDFHRNVEQQREIGLEAAGRGGAQRAQRARIQAASVALIRESGIDEAIAQHDFACLEGGPNHVGYVLRASRIHQQRLGHRTDVKAVVQKESADRIPDGRAAGFPRHQDLEAGSAQALREAGKQGGLPAAFNPFDSDEHRARFRRGLTPPMSSNNMFGDVVEWLLGKGDDRRQYKRRPGQFHLWLMQAAGTDPLPGHGVELSPNGLMFLMPAPIPTPTYNLVLRIRETNVPVRVKTVRNDTVDHQGKQWYRYMGEFTGVAADHWDVIVRYVNDQPEPVDRSKEAKTSKPDDAYRLLPMAIQQKLIAKLVEQHKLEMPHPGQQPLMKMFYGGKIEKPGQKPQHRVNIHSRIKVKDEIMAYDSRFLVTDDGEITQA